MKALSRSSIPKAAEFVTQDWSRFSFVIGVTDDASGLIQTVELPNRALQFQRTKETEVSPDDISEALLNNCLANGSDIQENYSAILIRQETKEQTKKELESYVAELKTWTVDGEPVVEFPANYIALIEKLFLKNRKGYNCLKDWNGPRRFEDLPAAQLNNNEDLCALSGRFTDDDAVSQGLSSIRELDEQLQEIGVEEYIIEKETFPQKFHMKEARRRRKKQLLLERNLRDERQRVQELAQLQRALESTDVELSSASISCPAASTNLRSAFRLNAEQEAQVCRVMNASDAQLLENPFDCDVNIEETVSKQKESDWSGSRKSSLYQSLKPDYLVEMREEKERKQRMYQIDKKLQDLKTQDLCHVYISKEDIHALIEATKIELEQQDVMINENLC